MNIFDIGIIVILLICALVGWKKGVLKEAVSLVGLIVIFIVAYTFKEEIGNTLCKYLPGMAVFQYLVLQSVNSIIPKRNFINL